MTPLSAQSVQISEKLNRHYIKAVISEQALKTDTALYKAQIKDCDKMFDLKSTEVSSLEFALDQQKESTIDCKEENTSLQTKLDKKERRNKFLIKAVGTFALVATLEGFVIYTILR